MKYIYSQRLGSSCTYRRQTCWSLCFKQFTECVFISIFYRSCIRKFKWFRINERVHLFQVIRYKALKDTRVWFSEKVLGLKLQSSAFSALEALLCRGALKFPDLSLTCSSYFSIGQSYSLTPSEERGHNLWRSTFYSSNWSAFNFVRIVFTTFKANKAITQWVCLCIPCNANTRCTLASKFGLLGWVAAVKPSSKPTFKSFFNFFSRVWNFCAALCIIGIGAV